MINHCKAQRRAIEAIIDIFCVSSGLRQFFPERRTGAQIPAQLRLAMRKPANTDIKLAAGLSFADHKRFFSRQALQCGLLQAVENIDFGAAAAHQSRKTRQRKSIRTGPA